MERWREAAAVHRSHTHDMIIQPCLVFVAALTTRLASLWAQGQTPGPSPSEPSAIADALGELKRRYHARQVVVAGHSGGAALAAHILGQRPEVIDAALLVSRPCDVEQWRQHMFQLAGQPVFQGKLDTLSPIEQITGMSDQAHVIMMVGRRHGGAPRSQCALSSRGRNARQTRQVGATGGQGARHFP
jgi:pimeloyl-ACP methyl ester carboxylesterase